MLPLGHDGDRKQRNFYFYDPSDEFKLLGRLYEGDYARNGPVFYCPSKDRMETITNIFNGPVNPWPPGSVPGALTRISYSVRPGDWEMEQTYTGSDPPFEDRGKNGKPKLKIRSEDKHGGYAIGSCHVVQMNNLNQLHRGEGLNIAYIDGRVTYAAGVLYEDLIDVLEQMPNPTSQNVANNPDYLDYWETMDSR